MLKSILTILLTLALQTHAQIIETIDLATCLKSASQTANGLAPEEALYVFDIDNTVLSLNQNLGSVQWYRWQKQLIQDNIAKDRVADNHDELLSLQRLIYQISKSHLPETTIANQLTHLQRNGHPVIYHTSRSIDVRDITERELKDHGLLPLIKTMGPKYGYAGPITYESAPTNQYPVTFQNGVYMTTGQDKGVWLNLLLEKTTSQFKHIVFVDDELKNLQNVEREFLGRKQLTLCRYGQKDAIVRKFIESTKSAEIALWNKLQAVLLQFE